MSKPRIDAGNNGTKETYGAGQAIAVDVTWSEAVAWDVSASGAGIAVQLGIGNNTRQAGLVTGGATSGTATALRFTYDVVAADTDSDGITVNADASGRVVALSSGATLKNEAGTLDASLAHAGLGAQSGHLVAGGTADPGNTAPAFNGASGNVGAPPLSLVSRVTNRSDFSDADGDPLLFTLSVSRDDTHVPGTFTWAELSETNGLIYFMARTACALANLSPPVTGSHTTTATLTATDPDGDSASARQGYVIPSTACPSFSSALASGTTLAVTLSADAHGTSPGADEFTVKVGGTAVALAAASPVAVSGATVTLTLADAVTHGQTVTVSYAPDEEAMTSDAVTTGPMAVAFTDRPVIVNAALDPTQTASTLVSNTEQSGTGNAGFDTSFDAADGFTTGSNASGYLLTSVGIPINMGTPQNTTDPTYTLSIHSASSSGCATGVTSCPGASLGTLTNPSFLSEGINMWTASGAGIDLDAGTTYFLVLGVTSTGNRAVSQGLTVSDSEDNSSLTGWSIADAGLVKGSGDWSTSARGVSSKFRVNGVTKTPTTVTGVAISSTPSHDADNNNTPETYGLDEDIEVQLTFSRAVTVTGTPRLKIKMDPAFGEFQADYESGSGTATLTFAYTVASPNKSPGGIAVLQNTLELNGGTIRSGTTDATLAHTGRAHDAGHKVDYELDSTNNAPTVANPIPDQAATAGAAFSYAFPANTFADQDAGDTLTYSATQSDDSALPSWLSFDGDTRTFSGTPQPGDTGAVSVKVTASDGTDSVSDTFNITVAAADTDPAPPTGTGTPPPGANAPSSRPARAVGLRVVRAGPESIRLSWKLSDGEQSRYPVYDVFRCTVADAGADCDPWDGLWVGTLRETNAWTDTDVTEGETYRYAVAGPPYGRDDLSLAVTVTAQAPAGPPPSAPTELAVMEAGPTHVRLRWQAPAPDGNGPVQTIDIYRCRVDNDPDCDKFLLLASRGGAAPARYRDNDDVEPGATYRYAVAANRSADLPAPWSEPATVTTAPPGAPPVGVSPARVMEAPGATLDFRVSLGKAAAGPVSVDYATADGSARAGEDYVATTGTLTFMPGERLKTIPVPVLDDAHDEGEETLELTLSNVSGGYLSANATTATGTIENADPLPRAWLARFGRTGAVHIVDILDTRFDSAAPTGDRLVLGGQAVDVAAMRASFTGRQDSRGDTSETRGQSKIAGNVADDDNGDDFTLTPSIPGEQGVADSDPVSHWMPEQVRHDGEETGGTSDYVPVGAGASATALERALWQALTNPGALDVDKRFLSQSSFHLSLTDALRGRDTGEHETRGQSNIARNVAGGEDGGDFTLTPPIPDSADGHALQTETARAAPERPGHWSLWGQGALTRFQGMDDGVNLDGEVLTGLLGLDYAKDRWLAGLALAYHDGDGGYRAGNGIAGDLDSSLITVNPYLRYALTPRLSVWGTAGYGTGTLTLLPRREDTRGQGKIARNVPGGSNSGDFTLTPSIPDRADSPDNEPVILTPSIDGQAHEAQPIETDMSLSMGALGVKGIVISTAATELAIKSDALWVRTASETTDGLQGAVADTSRIRLLLTGRHQRLLPNDALLSPTFELGIRYDDGDAETGFGMELGGGLQYADPALGLSAETRARVLIAHEDGGYEEWGLGGSVSLDPGRLGRGLALRLDSGWGIARSNAEALWQRQTTAGMAPQYGPVAQARFNAELGYGLDVPWTYAILTPYGGMEWAGSSRTLRLGWRFDLGQQLNLSLEGERMESGYERADHSLMLRTTLPW